ncbi:MAG: serine/threonine protein kinase [Myxococcales bacterium]|nr:serine/threonine protein kinase [Myxococcales bacterium]
MSVDTQARVGRYLLFKSLKKGGMARVFLGLDPDEPERLLAIKTLLPNLVKDRIYREMFASEGKVGVRLEHPNIVRTFEHGVEKGTPYIVMDFLFGFDLSTVLRRMRTDGENLPVPLAVTLARHVASGLAHAHALCDEFDRPLDIVNRDVSPGNIMIGFDGRVRLIDFGIAQTTIDVKSQIGSIKGKISYMAPEQVRGLPVDHRVDLFSLGTVLYEALTGVQPFNDEGDFATMEKVRRAEAPPPSAHRADIDAALDKLVARAMARDASDRFQHAEDMVEAFDGWLEAHGGPVSVEAFAQFMRTLFEQRITEMMADIETAKRRALGGQTHPPGEPDLPSEPGRLISEDMLAEIAGLAPEPAVLEPIVPPPAARSPGEGRGLWIGLAALALVAIAGLIWATLR